MTPHSIGPYVLQRRLGSGGEREVFLALQETPIRREVVLKLLRSSVDSRQVLKRFDRERRTLAMLDHVHIARVFDAGLSADGHPYFVMEHVDGRPLLEYCECRELDLAQRLQLLVQVCNAVQHAHHKGIVHRDLRPSTVLVSEANGKPVCRIVDFGLARALRGEAGSETVVTLAGELPGDPAYTSPEQAGLGRDVDTRTDVYTLGVLLYELLTGRRPLEEALAQARGPAEVERVLREEVPVRPGAHRSDLPEDLDWIVLRCLEKDRERRYGSPAELAADLERFLAREPIEARPHSLGYRLARFAARRRALVLACGGALAALVGGATTTTLLYTSAHAAETREQAVATDLGRLADWNLLSEAERASDALWPALPVRLPELEAWIERYASPLRARAPEHRARLALLTGSAAGAGRSEDWERSVLTELLAGLDRLLDPAPGTGILGSILARIETARRLAEEERRPDRIEAWREAVTAIRASPRYRELELRRHVDLVPLGENPRTGLWEFWHVPSGDAPVMAEDPDAQGRWRITPATGLVLVLLPGGPYVFGSQSGDPDAPRYDPFIETLGHLDSVDLVPFFVSKYEMTQGQWRRITGRDPSHLRFEDEAHPVERVSWHDCNEALRRIGMRLPTEPQWEFAARGGSDTPWWSGASEADLAGCANIADRSMHEAGELHGYACTTTVDDGWVTHSPVGTFRPNGFGLHDTAGNVYEWCQDVYGSFGVPRHPGDGETTLPSRGVDLRIDRGGSFRRPALQARVAELDYFPAGTRIDYLGVRPARGIGPP